MIASARFSCYGWSVCRERGGLRLGKAPYAERLGQGKDVATNGNDNIDLNSSESTRIDALGGDDAITYVWPPEPDWEEKKPIYTVDGGSGLDSLRFFMGGEGYQQGSVVLDARTGRLPDIEFTDIERVVLESGRGNDLLIGLDGNDVLNGGTLADEMRGGLGNDLYSVETKGDMVVELAEEGIDTIRQYVPYTLPANVENLIMVGGLSGRGNELDNNIRGNRHNNEIDGFDGNDFLDGLGGYDIMRGGRGDDTYVVDNAYDDVREVDGLRGGSDTVRSSISYTLGDLVENLVLLGDALTGTGNAGANRITGNALANVLDGRAGADRMAGLGGGDRYFVDDSDDVVIEVAGGGRDTVLSTVSYRIGAHVEKLTLTGGSAINASGNSGENVLTGNAAANTLSGAGGDDTILGGRGNDRIFGGTGNDSLRGEGGADRFYFDTPLNAATNVDHLVYFTPADDTILLKQAVFSGIAATGALSGSAFRTGRSAADASDRIIYDPATGNVFYDADGKGGAAQVLFATVSEGTALTAGDFIVY